MQQNLIQHCKHCKHRNRDGYCALRNQEIEIPNWTTCKNWNKDGKIEGSLCAIVEDEYQYFELPYWYGNRPKIKQIVGDFTSIHVKDDNNKTLTFRDCEDYLRKYYGENSLECPNVSDWENLKLIILQIKVKKLYTYWEDGQIKLSYKGLSQLSVSDILYPLLNT